MGTYDQLFDDYPVLDKLLKQQDIGMLDNVSRISGIDEGFKNEYSGAYYDAFKNILDTHLGGEKEWKIIAAIRAGKVVANDAALSKVAADMSPYLSEATNDLTEIREVLKSPKANLITEAGKIDKAYGHLPMGIINLLDSDPKVAELRDEYVGASLDICDQLSTVKPTKEEYKYAIYNVVMNNLEKIEAPGIHAERLKQHVRKIGKKRTGVDVKYVLGIVFFVLYIIFRIVVRLND